MTYTKMTLENIDEIQSIHRTDFYRLITGQDRQFNFGSTQLPEYRKNVRPDNMDNIMKVVEKFEKRYCNNGYYQHHVDKIRVAHAAKDYDTFSQEIGELLVSIEWD